MARGIAIHIGVNRPASKGHCTLSKSEGNAWGMAELAHQAGYGDIHLLRGIDATVDAVRHTLTSAVQALEPRQTLLVTYSGHGSRVRETGRDERGERDRPDERDGQDETWCLHDKDLVDDELVKIWRLAASDTRILIVSESCYGGGMKRDDDPAVQYAPRARPVYRSAGPVMRGVRQYAAEAPESCISRAPMETDGIRASVLVMTASAEAQKAREGLYSRHLLALWNRGEFPGSFCALHAQLCERVRRDNPEQDPQIMMAGKADPGFPLQRAFHLDGPMTRSGWR